jgi:hypothetical protein
LLSLRFRFYYFAIIYLTCASAPRHAATAFDFRLPSLLIILFSAISSSFFFATPYATPSRRLSLIFRCRAATDASFLSFSSRRAFHFYAIAFDTLAAATPFRLRAIDFITPSLLMPYFLSPTAGYAFAAITSLIAAMLSRDAFSPLLLILLSRRFSLMPLLIAMSS